MASTTDIKFPAKVDSIADIVYPIGSIYLSINNVNPGTLFGGTWESWGSGRMIVGVDNSNDNFKTAEKTGGAATHTHTGPSHTHTISSHTHTGPSHTHTINGHTHTGPSHTHTGPSHTHTTGDCILTEAQMPKHRHGMQIFGYVGESTTANHYQAGFGNVGVRDNFRTDYTGSGTAHNHGATGAAGTGNTGAAGTGNTGSSGTLTSNAGGTGNTGGSGELTSGASGTGNTGSSSNLPPYITCYMWKRTA